MPIIPKIIFNINKTPILPRVSPQLFLSDAATPRSESKATK